MDFTRRSFLAQGALALAWPALGRLHGAARPVGTLVEGGPLAFLSAQTGRPKSLIIDTDPGVDDAVSILLAFKSKEVNVECLTVVGGNVEAEFGQRNARTLVELAGHPEVPVALGATRPLVRKMVTARPYHGANGFGNIQLPEPRVRLIDQHAMDFIISLVKARPNQISILAIGPLTNIALALLKDPSIAPQIAELVFMGGTINSNGNVTPVATFNVYADPEAARIVMNSGISRIGMVGTDVTTKVQFTAADFDKIDQAGTQVAHIAAELGRFRLNRVGRDATGREPTTGFNDLPATAYVIQSRHFTTERMKVDVETAGPLTLGQTVANRRNVVVKIGPEGDHFGIVGSEPVEPNVDVAVAIEEQQVKALFMERLSAS